MAVALDSSGTPNAHANGVTTIDLTTLTVGTGANRALFGLLAFGVATTLPTGITVAWDPAGTNQAMALISTQANDLNTEEVQIYSLVSPTTGNKTLRASWTGSAGVVLGGVEFSGVHQLNTWNNVTKASNAALSNPTVTVVSATDGATVAVVVDTGGGTPSMNQTLLYNDSAPTLIDSGANYALGGTSNVHTDNTTQLHWAMMGVQVLGIDVLQPMCST